MSVTLNSGRQHVISSVTTVLATDFDSSIVGTSGTSLIQACNLPEGAKIVSGYLAVKTAFNTGGVRSYGVLTSTAAPADTNTVTIGTQVYTFKTTLTSATAENEVLIGISEATSLANLVAAINGTGTPGTQYGSDTVARTDVVATTDGAHTLTITSVAYSSANDTLATTETHANATWGGATLVDYVPTADVVSVTIGSTTYVTTASVATSGTNTAFTLSGEKIGAGGDTVDLTWNLADTATLAPTAGELNLIVDYVVEDRATFSQG